jgi:hypothetical protein
VRNPPVVRDESSVAIRGSSTMVPASSVDVIARASASLSTTSVVMALMEVDSVVVEAASSIIVAKVSAKSKLSVSVEPSMAVAPSVVVVVVVAKASKTSALTPLSLLLS